MSNTGGRAIYGVNDDIRILELDGSVSRDVYVVDQDRSDRKGHLRLIHKNSGLAKKVHHRRILTNYDDDMAVVLENGNKFYALCPKCGKTEEILPTRDDITCPQCGQFSLYWLSTKPDLGVYQTKTLNERKPKKEMAKNNKVDITQLLTLEECELWSKTVAFDHERIDARAFVLIYTAESPRKYCFNTYDGMLGKKSRLYIEEFISNASIDGISHVPWFSISEIEAVRKKLEKSGYALHKEV